MSKETTMLIFTNAKDNNNKFYEVTLQDDDTILLRWGRVGAEGQQKTTSGGLSEYKTIIHKKMSKGYVKAQTLSVNTSSQQNKIHLMETAKKELIGEHIQNNVLSSLVKRLTEINRHQIQIASGGSIKVDQSGIISTALGLVTADTVEKARILLNHMEKYIETKDFNQPQYIHSLENYLQLIPQKIPSQKSWYETFFTNFSSLQKQNSFLDQLSGSIDLYQAKEKKALAEHSVSQPQERIFKTQLHLLDDLTIFKQIEKLFYNNKNKKHVTSNLRLKNVYVLENSEEEAQFEVSKVKYGNVQTLWHGTRAFNILSILKNQLIIPKHGGSYQITGRMFGNGIYFSDQSTKALNYSFGYWDTQQKDVNCFAFLADVALGKEFCPSHYSNHHTYPVKGYDSTFAKAGVSGVLNNEMIVYNPQQVHLKYLCEFY